MALAHNGSGVFSPVANSFNPAVAGTEIDEDDWASTLADIVAGLTLAICKDGQSTTTAAITFAAGVQINNTGLKVLDTNASHYLVITPGSDLTANRILTITTGDAARTITLGGDLAVATSANINTGTDNVKFISPDALAGSNFGIRYVAVPCFAPSTACATGNGKAFFHIPAGLNGMNLVSAHAAVYVAGTTGLLEVQIRNVTQAADMLSVYLKVDTGEVGSDTAATPYSIDTAEDDVATNDRIAIDVDTVHTTPATGLVVTLGFQLP